MTKDAEPPATAKPRPARLLAPFREHLRFKVGALIIAILVLGFGVLMILNIRREAQTLIASHRETARLLGGSILTSIENGMLEGRPDIVRQLVRQLKTELRDVRRIDVYRRNGVEAFADLDTVNEVNRIAGLETALVERITRLKREPGERINDPMFQKAVQTVEPQEAEEWTGGDRVLTQFRPLRNLKECQACHGEDHQVRGVVRISLGLGRLDEELRVQDYFSAFLEIIRANHGDVNETAGDGLMVIFQSEGSRTRHALNAAGAAFQVLGKVAELNEGFVGVYPAVAIHVGINSGPALVGATKLDAAGGGRWTFTASGPTTNLAARIAGLTRGGEVKVGPETADRIKGQYVLEDTGEHSLKNVSQPVRVFRLVPAGVYKSVQA